VVSAHGKENGSLGSGRSDDIRVKEKADLLIRELQGNDTPQISLLRNRATANIIKTVSGERESLKKKRVRNATFREERKRGQQGAFIGPSGESSP